MKNLETMELHHRNQHCMLCGIKGFFCESSMGRCGPSCPCCGQRHFFDWGESATYRRKFDWDDPRDMRNQYLYCKDCGIVFALGCVHYASVFGYSEDQVLNAHFIQKWKHRETQEVFHGMPVFDNPDDWFENVTRVEVLEMGCPQSNSICWRNRCRFEGGCKLIGSL
jgi:hypothetical protein